VVVGVINTARVLSERHEQFRIYLPNYLRELGALVIFEENERGLIACLCKAGSR
jgi:hypothetical protein